jgi:hypothetical protein
MHYARRPTRGDFGGFGRRLRGRDLMAAIHDRDRQIHLPVAGMKVMSQPREKMLVGVRIQALPHRFAMRAKSPERAVASILSGSDKSFRRRHQPRRTAVLRPSFLPIPSKDAGVIFPVGVTYLGIAASARQRILQRFHVLLNEHAHARNHANRTTVGLFSARSF